MTKEYFLEKANKKHNFKYKYNLKDNFKNDEKIEVICEIHGSFLQLCGNHLKGWGCQKCSYINKTTPLNLYIEKANKKHNYQYNYDKNKLIHYN